MVSEKQVETAYQVAKERYAEIGVDTEDVYKRQVKETAGD